MQLKLDKISMSYGNKKIFQDLSYQFTEGVYGLLGANGTGKTTLMKIITYLIDPLAGEIYLDSQPRKDYYHQVGILPQETAYYPQFTASDFLLYMATLKGMSKEAAATETERLLKLVGLSDVKNDKIATFSGGMKRRLGIAQALLNNPKILILDEPTAGLDPKERVRFRHIISKLSTDKIILLSTHIVSDIEAIAKEILLLKDGQFIQTGSLNQLLKPLTDKVFEVSISDPRDKQAFYQKHLIVNERADKDHIQLRLISETPPTTDARSVTPQLEDLYLYHFQEEVSP